jgi:GH24 family phage-related lysozyme (muramidase)
MSQEKFTNIVGVPLKKYVKEQLYTRSFQGSTIDSRSNDQILYLANKNCWIRLVSFVNVEDDQLRKSLDIQGKNRGGTPDDVSKQWMLFGGTSYYQNDTNNLRFGLETNDPSTITNNSAYGLGGVDQFGYRPMPGIISATIEHAGTAGSLRIANIKFKVWNINQLNAIDALYFRLGYSCLLEWGHTSYLDNNTNKLVTIGAEINPLDVFKNDLYKTKEGIIRGISDKRKKSYGNYDGLYGLISNYEWSQATDGSYDCTIKLTGLGSVIDSLKINQAFSMPGDETKNPNQSTDNSNVQIKGQTPEFIESQKPRVVPNTNKISWPEIGEVISSGDKIFINFEKLEKRKKDLEELINQNIILKTEGVNISYIYLQSNEEKVPELYKKNNPQFIGKGILNSVQASYARFIEISDNETTNKFIISNKDYKTLNEQKLKEGSWEMQLINNNTVNLRKIIKLKQPITQPLFTGNYTIPLSNTAAAIIPGGAIINLPPVKEVKTFELTSILIDINFKLNYQENFEILRPIGNNPQGAIGKEIKSPALRRFYTNYTNTVWNNNESKEKNIEIGSLKVSIITSLPKYTYINDNSIYISFQIETKDIVPEGTNPSDFKKGTRIQAVQNKISELLDSLNYFDSGDLKDFITITPYNNKNIFQGDIYSNSITNQRIFIAKIEYKYNEQKVINPSNTNDNIPTESLTAVQSTIPEVYFSNIDKFLIELRDFASNNNTGEGEIPGVYDYITKQLKNGPLDPIRVDYENTILPELTNDVSRFDIEKQLASFIYKGFNSEFLSGELESGDEVKSVDFKELFKVYNSGLSDDGNQGESSKFYYIKLGLLLYYINNNSIFYEKDTNGTIKKPFVYLDFNPETNYCFTTPYHLSVDPGVCMIKINLNNEAYKQLFPPGLAPLEPFNSGLDKFSKNVDSGFASVDDVLSSRGKLMNIPVNIDHIINIIQSQSNNNPKTDVLLRSFLEILMDDINKSLGNINNFRVGYYDDGNTLRIYDDQVINPPSGQSIISNNSDSALLPIEPTVIPIIGKNSIVRSLTLKSEVSTKMSQMIAFSSQAGNLGSQNTDASGLGDTNIKLIDRILPVKETVTGASSTNIETKQGADKDAAKIFDDSIKNIYQQGIYNKSQVNTLKIYYSTATNRLKAEKDGTKARQVLPISINISTDGISGMSLLEGFTVPKDVLPSQYLNSQGQNRVGFAIAGLNHTIENNQWVTAIRGQMINIPSITSLNAKDFGTINDSVGGGRTSQRNTRPTQTDIDINIASLNISEKYLETALQFIANEEGFKKEAYWDVNAYRVGYGNDKYIDIDNKLKEVTASTVITQTQALQTLKYTVVNTFQPTVIRNIGKDNWNKLNDNQKAALLSYAYNVGSIRTSISNPVKNNNYSLAAQEIQRGPVTGGGVVYQTLVKRRKKEASLFLS